MRLKFFNKKDKGIHEFGFKWIRVIHGKIYQVWFKVTIL